MNKTKERKNCGIIVIVNVRQRACDLFWDPSCVAELERQMKIENLFVTWQQRSAQSNMPISVSSLRHRCTQTLCDGYFPEHDFPSGSSGPDSCQSASHAHMQIRVCTARLGLMRCAEDIRRCCSVWDVSESTLRLSHCWDPDKYVIIILQVTIHIVQVTSTASTLPCKRLGSVRFIWCWSARTHYIDQKWQ